VAPEPQLPRRLAPSAEDLALASRLTERNRAAGERYLRELCERLVAQGFRVATRLAVSPRRARAVSTIADEAAVDLVVLAAHGRTGDGGERCGSVAARLVEQSRWPILVLQDLPAVRAATAAEEAARNHPGH